MNLALFSSIWPSHHRTHGVKASSNGNEHIYMPGGDGLKLSTYHCQKVTSIDLQSDTLVSLQLVLLIATMREFS